MKQVKRELRVKPKSYQPTTKELNEAINVDATPERLAQAVLRPVKVVHKERK